MANLTSVALGAGLTLIVVAIHYARGTGWEPPADISQEVLERRAAAVPETDFPEPMNRSIGGGAAGAIPAGEGGAELEEGEDGDEEAEGFDPEAIPDDEVEYYEVEFAKEGETIEIANNENILDVGEEEGWDLPYACRQGQCVSCAGQIQDGPALDYIQHEHNEALFDDDMDDGYCLTCVAYPIDDFTLETGEQP
ncbi:2Fe-2S iron-sulfur cluster-binding protein [Halosimplex sp. TS25]|uniref:2Fe-2S iron-sulfur cluster-binding protein n=1 Tax=Halosimplex rarum TaxID=3396619 RepID=UPI0039E8FBD1